MKKLRNMNMVHQESLQLLRDRGERVGNTIEVLNTSMTLTDPTKLEITCPERKFSSDYALVEFMFYLGRDRNVGSMPEFAKIWGQIRDSSNEVESNYGQYVFSELWGKTAKELSSNPDTRRAVIPILDSDHIGKNSRDYPCTGFIQFMIRNGKVNLQWNMRSQDAIFGMANDFFAAAMILQMMRHELLKDNPFIKLGSVTFNVNSYHMYERHYRLLSSPWHKSEGRKYRINADVNMFDYGISGKHSKTEVLGMLEEFKQTGVSIS